MGSHAYQGIGYRERVVNAVSHLADKKGLRLLRLFPFGNVTLNF